MCCSKVSQSAYLEYPDVCLWIEPRSLMLDERIQLSQPLRGFSHEHSCMVRDLNFSHSKILDKSFKSIVPTDILFSVVQQMGRG